MIAFEISLNGEVRCIAGFPNHHALFVLIKSQTIENKKSILMHVQGNDLSVFEGLNFSENMSPQEKMPQIVALITNGGFKMKEWINEDFSSEVKIDIRIIEITSDLLTEGKDIFPDMKNLASAASQFLDIG